MSIENYALFLGYALLFVGGSLLSIIILVALGWAAFEIVAQKVGYTKRIREWRDAAVRERRG